MVRSRRGSFGLQPRVAPNVSGQIVALAREYVAKRDALIMDAWRQGGTFEGKKATDEMVLGYWNERMQGLDPKDPEYEASKNQVLQLTYAVAQSKADVQHLQGKLSDNAYAKFFLDWAQKVPANSEFYRTLQKDAAQLIESAKARGRASGDAARVKAFNAFVSATTDGQIAIGDAMTADLDAMSKKTGLSVTGNGDELLTLLTQDIKNNPTGHRRLLDAVKKGDPSFDGNLTEGYFTQHIHDAVQGYALIADRATAAGYVSAYASATQGESQMSSWGQNIQVWPVATSYSLAETAFLRVWNDPNASQMSKTAAAEALSTRFTTLAKSPGIDAGAKSMLEADAKRLIGQDGGDSPSFGTAMLGRQGVDPQMSMTLGAWVATAAEQKANPAAYAYGPVNAAGQYDPTGSGPMGIVPAGSVPPGAMAVIVPGVNGTAVMAMVVPHTVYTIDPNNPSAAPSQAGLSISYNVGGKTITMWGYTDANKVPHWSLASPVAEGSKSQTDNRGDIYVTPPAVKLADQIAGLRDAKTGELVTLPAEQVAALLTGGQSKVTTSTASKGKAGATTTEIRSVQGGHIVSTTTVEHIDANGKVTASEVTHRALSGTASSDAFSKSALAAGDIKGVTFTSPMEASVASASSTQTADQVTRFASDPTFQQAFLAQSMNTLGTTNPYDPRIAAAWKSITTPSQPTSGGLSPDERNAAGRTDLSYPGLASANAAAKKAANGGQVGINFGGQTLTIPGLPSYLNQVGKTPATGGPAAANPWASVVAGMGQAQQPGAAPTPTPTITPGPTAIAPTASPSPTATMAPTPSPTATPLPTPSPSHSSTNWRAL